MPMMCCRDFSSALPSFGCIETAAALLEPSHQAKASPRSTRARAGCVTLSHQHRAHFSLGSLHANLQAEVQFIL